LTERSVRGLLECADKNTATRAFPPGGRLCGTRPPMNDTAFILISIAFFAVSVAYAYFCEKIR
jgi:hypothetical protein